MTSKVELILFAFLVYFIGAYVAKKTYIPDPNFTVGPNVPGEKVLLFKPISKTRETGNIFAVERYNLFSDLADSENDPFRSPIRLYENAAPLGPSHATEDEIADLGRGRFRHWKKNGATIYFSTSDNTDPNTNGRAYWVVNPMTP